MAEQARPKGRARGRARGTALLPEAAAGPRGVERMPPHPPEAGEGVPGSGRGRQRGAMRAREPGPRGDVIAEASRGMGRMTVSGRAPVMLLGPRRNFDPSLFDPETKPEHITNKKGCDGMTVDILTNYFKLNASKQWCLYQYRVDYEPDVDHRGARKGMLRDHQELIGKTFIFDGTMLYTLQRLPEKVNVVHSQRKFDQTTVKLTIALTSELPPNSPICIQLYNIIFRAVLAKLGMKQVGRHYYDPGAAFSVACRQVTFELWPGFITSILKYENNVMLCAEVSHKLMRKDTVLDVMNGLLNECSRRGRNFHEECQKFLVGQIVLTRYNNNTYRVDGIEWDLNVSMKFKKGEEQISYLQYYQDHYNIKVNDKQQPLLLSRPKKREARRGLEVIHLVPELCTVTGLTDELRSDFHTMKALAEHTKQGPTKRVQALSNFIKRISGNKEVTEHLNRWGLRFDNDLISLQGRTLPPEKIMFGKQKICDGGPQASWDSQFRNCKLLRTVNLECWHLICTGNDEGTANNLVQKMISVSQAMDFRMSRPKFVTIRSDRVEIFRSAIQDIASESKNCQLICCLLPSNRKDRYDQIKRLCCVDLPVPTQVVLARTLSKPQRVMSIATKIAIQINCKLGGEAWAVNIPLKGCMIIGIDTYHDSAQKGQSVGGFIASINPSFTRWYSNTTFQQTGTEMIDGLKRCFSGALKKYHRDNGQLPGKIFVFRDGVGDGQLETVREHEVPQMLQCLELPETPDYKPNFAYIVVKKRVNARFFTKGRQALVNPPPGTIIDDVVTRPEWYDFFVVSQSVREGTVSPTHYNVIFDKSGLQPNHMQRLAYKLCHLYYNWPGTVRVPAPCLYAHKLAFLVGQSIHKPPSPALQDKLYFL
ncbi:piwi-like protein 1 [Styela clava]|uniref:piwi-like protein 1 n=1 Tax=Styela clava TaxID=7725 RepID=UPI00193AA460|nr:piwi-like protein 1 [Styela clava]XP_039273655.1 piwi-like protein 1 [Styela clava]